jgi:hypothetical protein
VTTPVLRIERISVSTNLVVLMNILASANCRRVAECLTKYDHIESSAGRMIDTR